MRTVVVPLRGCIYTVEVNEENTIVGRWAMADKWLLSELQTVVDMMEEVGDDDC